MREEFDRLLAKLQLDYENIPNGEDLFQKISRRFDDCFNNPPTKEFEFVVQKNFTDEEVLSCLFCPTSDQVRYYPTLLHVANRLPTGHLVEHRIRSVVLPLTYLVHRKSWSFIEDFVIGGGLGVLASMLDDDNLFYRGQVMEIFMSVTDCDTFDWFASTDGDVTALSLHHRLLSLQDSPDFLGKLVQNRCNSYPGGSMRALQLLAFWLSWVRALKTRDQVLRLSGDLLEALRLWSEGQGATDPCAEEMELAKTLYEDFSHNQFQRLGTNDANLSDTSANTVTAGSQSTEATSMFISGVNVDQPEGIAVTVLPPLPLPPAIPNENTQQPPLPLRAQPDEGNNDSDTHTLPELPSALQSSDFPPEVCPCDGFSQMALPQDTLKISSNAIASLEDSVVINDHEIKLRDIFQETVSLKERGNQLYREGHFEESIATYKESLVSIESLRTLASTQASSNISTSQLSSTTGESNAAAGVFIDIQRELSEHTIETSLHFNIATALWKLTEKVTDEEEDKSQEVGHVRERILGHCEQALAIDPTHRKALYRMCACLLSLGRPHDALEILNEKMALYSSDSKENELLKSMRTKCCGAAILTSAKSSAGGLNVNALSYQKTEQVDNTNADVDGRLEGVSHSQAPATIVQAQHQSAAVAEVVGDRVAKLLGALQTRKQRESSQCSHAWNGWEPPVDADVDDNVTGSDQKGEGLKHPSGAGKDNPLGSMNSDAATKETSTSIIPSFDNLKSPVSNNEGLDINERGHHNCDNSSNVSHQARSQSNNGDISVGNSLRKQPLKQPISKASTVARVEGDGKVKPVKKLKKKGPSSEAIEAYNKLKRLATRFEKEARLLDWVVVEHFDNTTPSANSDSSSVLAEALMAIETIWSEKVTLQETSSCSIEESLLVLLLNAFILLSINRDTSKAEKLLIEISSCERFFTELKLNLCDKPKLKDTLMVHLGLISSHPQGKCVPNDLFFIVKAIQESLS